MGKTEKPSEIKILARLAKARLKSGYFEDCGKMAIAKNKIVNEAYDTKNAAQGIFHAAKSSNRLAEEEERERALYPVIIDIVESGEGLNPLGRLIDRAYYESLDFSGKQRYVLELSEMYKKLSEKYLEEKANERRL